MALVGDAGLSTYENNVVEENTKSIVNHVEKLDGNKGTQECDSMSGRKLVDSAEQSPYQNEDAMDYLYEVLESVDDCNRGERLDRQAVIRAMMEELEFFKKMNVYRKMKRKDALAPGSKLISTTWVDTNKGTTENPKYQVQACGKRNPKKRKVRILHGNSTIGGYEHSFDRVRQLPEFQETKTCWNHRHSARVLLRQSQAEKPH